MGFFKTPSLVNITPPLVCGRMKGEQGSIALEIGRHRSDRKKMSVRTRKGRAALTEWTLIEQFNECSLLEVGIQTGRTHQIRVHLAAVHHPIIGDGVYGGRKCIVHMTRDAVRCALQQLNRPFLHACRLSFDHPATGQHLLFSQPLPPELNSLVTVLREDTCS